MDLISKEDAVALIKAEMDKIRTHSLVDGTARINLRLAKNIIEDMPTIDIVRCKDCKIKRIYDGETKYYYCALEDRPNRQWSIDETDYCSWGERDE